MDGIINFSLVFMMVDVFHYSSFFPQAFLFSCPGPFMYVQENSSFHFLKPCVIEILVTFVLREEGMRRPAVA
jgi:hypothetical protein